MGEGSTPTAQELRSLLLQGRRLLPGIAALYERDFRDRSEDHRLIALLYELCHDLRLRVEVERRQVRNQSYDALIGVRRNDPDSDASVFMLSKSYRLLTVASYCRPHTPGTGWNSGWLFTYEHLDLNWGLVEELGWLYLTPEDCNLDLSSFTVPDDVRPEVDYAARYGYRTLGAVVFNCAD
ncbi:MAG: hypothetical protein AAF467_04110 [Actinomycetota bacterium]